MKIVIFGLLTLFGVSLAILLPQPAQRKHLLGEKECTYGPSYWCQNLTNAAGCRATKHCIQTVWIHKKYPPDTSSICDTCKTMVKQARDQLLSNETQEEIKEVFEGSCALLHIKPIVKECDKIADEFIPELVDTLASEMDPQTVCAVAGLCNSVRITQLLAEAEQGVSKKFADDSPSRNKCDDCNTVMDIVVKKFNNMNQEEFLESALRVCGKLNSFSDACSNLVITNLQDIYNYLKQNLNAGDVCLLSGECYANFHKHDIQITPMSKIGYVPVKGEKDDLPCELCEQLVNHLRDILTANTTEAEFKQVLEGLCKETKSTFRSECLSLVNTYYDVIYNDLVKGLNANSTCELIGICPGNSKDIGVVAPLLTPEAIEALNSNQALRQGSRHGLEVRVMKPKEEKLPEVNMSMQLPIDRLMPAHLQVYNQQFCVFCQYFLHYVQNEITDPTVEDEVKEVIDKACSKLPRSVNATCVEFVNTYEPALVAILAQEIDPSQICPLIKACPSQEDSIQAVDIFQTAKSSSQCPLCLYAVTELESMIKGKRTKEEIEESLKKLCDHLPGNLKPECVDFVNTYTNELIEMLVADFKPQEVCVYLKLCTDDTPVMKQTIVREEHELWGGDTETNVIFDDTYNGHQIEAFHDEKCVLCEFIMKEIDDQLKNKKTDDEIKNIVHDICKVMPKSVEKSCDNFVNQYADAIIILLQEAMDPSSICSYLKFCKQQNPLEFVKTEASKCGVCTIAADIMQAVLRNPKIGKSIEHIFEKTCRGIPPNMKKTCEEMTKEKGIEFVALLSRENSKPDSVCFALNYCNSLGQVAVN
ncbi:hypothetical protein ABEB36_005353 [Hypothenemus hampei]|uniref:Prosaposin n=1 Tax=Hypothenemus hampei TaxID=57062 RepID=A0ABD1EXY8_HYPHA